MKDDVATVPWRDLNDEDREREYTPSSCVEDIMPFLHDYRSLSEAARRECESAGHSIIELAYGDEPTQTLDLVLPQSGSPTAAVVYIHGGYWQQLSKLDSFFSGAQCVDHGVAFAAIDYTLAPQATLDDIVAECHAAIAVVRSNAAAHNIDPARIMVCGSSAGGHLSAMVGLGGPDGWRPAAVGLISGVFELEPLVGTTINDAVGLDVAAAHRNSPMLARLDGFPAATIAYGDNETSQFKWQSHEFARLLTQVDVTVSVLEVEGRNHFDVVVDLCDPATVLGRKILNVVDRLTSTAN